MCVVHSCVWRATKRRKWRAGYLWCARWRIMDNWLTCRRTIWQNKLKTMSPMPFNDGNEWKHIESFERTYSIRRYEWTSAGSVQKDALSQTWNGFGFEFVVNENTKYQQHVRTVWLWPSHRHCRLNKTTVKMMNWCVCSTNMVHSMHSVSGGKAAQQSDAKLSIKCNYRLHNHNFSTLAISLSLICCTLWTWNEIC